jgi:mannose-6-phosphate isomerase-like protein (cupin superfamily)
MSYPPDKYPGNTGEISAIYKPAAGEPDLSIGELTTARYLATGATTDGQFGLYRWNMAAKPSGTTVHFHRSISESFFVLSGVVRIFNGEQWIDAQAGDFTYVPEGGIHAFRNESGEPASMLLLFVPGAPREPYFETLSEMAAGRKLTPEELTRLFLDHDTYNV